jgi:glyoxylate reductase
MSKPRVFVTRLIPEQGLNMIRHVCQVDLWLEKLPPARPDLLKHISGVDGILCLLTDAIDRQVMEAAGAQLKVISNYAIGVDNIDISAATQLGIPVGNSPNVLTETTADFAFALLMAAARRVVEGQQVVRNAGWKTWDPLFMLGIDVHHATLGIFGFGRIGRTVAHRASGFDMNVLYYDPTPDQSAKTAPLNAKPVNMDTLLAESDFITIHTPLNEQTHHMFNQSLFAKMKPSAILINTARGAIVDPQALYQALKEHRIAFAALDVTEPEPLPPDSPLLTLDNILVTPHIASASHITREKMSVMAAENLLAGLKGKRLPYCVNPQVYKKQVST